MVVVYGVAVGLRNPNTKANKPTTLCKPGARTAGDGRDTIRLHSSTVTHPRTQMHREHHITHHESMRSEFRLIGVMAVNMALGLPND